MTINFTYIGKDFNNPDRYEITLQKKSQDSTDEVRVNVKRYGSIIGPIMKGLGFAVEVHDGTSTVRYINRNSLVNRAYEKGVELNPNKIVRLVKTEKPQITTTSSNILHDASASSKDLTTEIQSPEPLDAQTAEVKELLSTTLKYMKEGNMLSKSDDNFEVDTKGPYPSRIELPTWEAMKTYETLFSKNNTFDKEIIPAPQEEKTLSLEGARHDQSIIDKFKENYPNHTILNVASHGREIILHTEIDGKPEIFMGKTGESLSSVGATITKQFDRLALIMDRGKFWVKHTTPNEAYRLRIEVGKNVAEFLIRSDDPHGQNLWGTLKLT